MAINLTDPQTFQTAVLIADTFTPINGSPGSIDFMLTQANGAPVSAAFEIKSTLGSLLVSRMTTTQMNAQNATNGMIIYNTSLNQFYGYQAGAWSQIGTGGGGSGTVTSITAAANIILTPNPITVTGTVALNPVLTGITSIATTSITSGNITISSDTVGDSNSMNLSTGGDLIINLGGAGSRHVLIGTTRLTQAIIDTTSGALAISPAGQLNLNAGTNVVSQTDIVINSNHNLILSNSGNTFAASIQGGAQTANSTYVWPIVRPNTFAISTVTVSGSTATMSYTSQIIDGGTSGNWSNTLYLGTNSGSSNVGAFQNVGVGVGALSSISTGAQNVAIGNGAGNSLTTASKCLLAGYSAGFKITTGSNNILLGYSGALITTGSDNIAAGSGSLNGAILNSHNISLGSLSLATLSSSFGGGDGNVSIGYLCAENLQQGSLNVFLGQEVVTSAINSSNSVVIGDHGAINSTVLSQSTIIGSTATAGNGSTSQVTYVGYGSGSGVQNLTNSGAFGANTIVSINNSINLGNACNVGINQPSPAHTLDILNVSNSCVVGLDDTGTVPSNPLSGVLLYSVGGVPTFRNSTGVVTIAGVVTSVSGTALNISSTGGTTPVLDLISTAVSPGSYTYGGFTVDQKGRLTAAASGAAPVLITGSTMTGFLTLNGNPTTPLEAAPKQYVDAISAGLSVKAPCYAGTTANLNATYNNGASGVGATLTNAGALVAFATDGVSPPINSRILVINQTTTFQNGIYTLTTVGSGAAAWVLTRATDYDTNVQIAPGSFVIINNGTTLDATGWIETATVTTIGTDPILFSEFGAEGAPNTSFYIVQGTADSNLPNAQFLGNLANGIVRNNSVTGILSIATPGTDYYSLNNPTRLLENTILGNLFISQTAGNTTLTGGQNVSIGLNSLQVVSAGNGNSAYGYQSLQNLQNISGVSGFGSESGQLINSGGDCCFFGITAGKAVTTATGATFIGAQAGISGITTATYLTLLGAFTTAADNLTNSTALGANTNIQVSNAINIGNNALVGINTASPLYTLHISNAQSQSTIYLANTTTVPGTPVGGGVLYVSGGSLNYKGSNGTTTVIAAA